MSNRGVSDISEKLASENEFLRARLEEAEEVLWAIRNGEVDALVLPGPNGVEVFTLKSADHAFRVLVEEMREGALIVAAEGSILYANRRFAEMVKLPLNEVIARSFSDFLTAEQLPEVESMIRQVRGGREQEESVLVPPSTAEDRRPPEGRGGREKGEFVLVAGNEEQSTVPVSLSASSFEMEGHLAVGVIATDLTVQKRSEQIAAANRAKDHFLAMLSHELRTPLTPVLSTVQLMQTDMSLSADHRECLNMIRRNVEMEARLIDDLLDLTRISRGKVELRPEVTDAHAAINGALEISEGDIVAKHLHVSLDLHARRHHVWADPARLQQVFWNLVKNAVKFTPTNGSIHIHSSNEDGRLRLEIADSGVGIDAETLPKLFNAFEQGDRDMTRRFGGLGLGLTISKALVDLQHGHLTAASPGRDQGATFTLDFKTVDPEPAKTPAPRQEPDCRKRDCRILLVDDHEDTLRVMTRLLRGLGYTVTTANGVQAALKAAGGESFDLLISDIGLPDGTGLDIMEQVKKNHALKGIALSGFGMDSDMERSKVAGFDAHLTKPVNFQALAAAIERVIGK